MIDVISKFNCMHGFVAEEECIINKQILLVLVRGLDIFLFGKELHEHDHHDKYDQDEKDHQPYPAVA